MPKIYSYLRVSTEDQDLEKDRMLVLDYANRLGVGPVHFETEKISGKTSWQKRKVASLIAQLQPGDLLIEPEMYRMGRSQLEIHLMADAIRRSGATMHLIRENIVLDGSPIADLILSILAGTGQFELRLTSERTKAGLRRARAEGKQLGRPTGPGKSKLDEKAVEIRSLLANGSTKKFIAGRYGCSESTLHEWIKKKKV
ncbi:recombinase family protein [Spirosoma areae]